MDIMNIFPGSSMICFSSIVLAKYMGDLVVGGVGLRKIIDDIMVKPSQLASSIAKKYGYRPYMVERYLEILGYEETVKLLEAFEKPLKPVVRCNDLRIDCDELVNSLEKLGFKLKHIPWSIHGYRVVAEPSSPSIGSTHEYLKGYYYVHRDAAPLIPGILLVWGGFKGRVLDACAAPGGKATQIAQLMMGEGLVVANDLVLYRLKALIGHVLRMGFNNIVVTWSDLRKVPEIHGLKYERILLDVPCSGEGTIMFDPGRKKRTSIRDLAGIVEREIELLESAIKLLKPRGLLAYVTCSIAPEENEYVVYRVLEKHPEVAIAKPLVKLFNWDPWIKNFHGLEFPRDYDYCIRTWPHRHGLMGFTTCLLTRKE